jgi:hypothetical protein
MGGRRGGHHRCGGNAGNHGRLLGHCEAGSYVSIPANVVHYYSIENGCSLLSMVTAVEQVVIFRRQPASKTQ